MRIDENGKLHYSDISRDIVIQASYLADMQDEHKVDDLIAFWTGLFPVNYGTPAVSHTERGVYVDGELWFFSSTSRDELGGGTGTRWIKGSELLRNRERWLLQLETLSRTFIREEIKRANDLIPMTYDFIGAVADFTLIVDLVKKKKSIYCSKACHVMETGIWKRISPRQRYKYAVKKGYKKIGVSNAFGYESRV